MKSPIRVRVFKGSELVSEQLFNDTLVKVGRHASAQVRLPERGVAAVHAVLTLDGEDVAVTDVSGERGTFVNGKPVGKQVLAQGDEIRIGTLRLLVDRLPEPEPVAESASAPVEASPREVEPAPMIGPEETGLPSPLDVVNHFGDKPFGSYLASEPLPPRPVGASGATALQLACYWGDTLLQVSQHPVPEMVWMGPTRRCALQAGGAERALVEPLDGAFALHVDTGTRALRRRGSETEVLRPGVHALAATDFAWLELGALRVEASFARQPTRVKVPLSSTIDFRLVNLVLALGFVAAAFAVAAATQANADLIADELSSDHQVLRIITMAMPTPPKRRQDAPQIQLGEIEPGRPAPAHLGKAGEAGDPTIARAKPKIGAVGSVRLNTNELVNHSGLLAGINNGSAAPNMLGSGGLGQVRAALGNVNGDSYGANGGFGGMAAMGTDHGGGGNDLHTYGIGGIKTAGRAGNNEKYGLGPAGLPGGKEHPSPTPTNTDVEVGGIDKEIVRRVIHDHIGQIRFCYEQRLAYDPALAGKIRVHFIITPAGDVPEARAVEGTTLADQEVRSCILARVRSWTFPARPRGSPASVTYPFWLRPSGD